jgi:hypothetical protein
VHKTKARNHRRSTSLVTHVLGPFCNASAKYTQLGSPLRIQPQSHRSKGSNQFRQAVAVLRLFLNRTHIDTFCPKFVYEGNNGNGELLSINVLRFLELPNQSLVSGLRLLWFHVLTVEAWKCFLSASCRKLLTRAPRVMG